jgi:hypothetical protein
MATTGISGMAPTSTTTGLDTASGFGGAGAVGGQYGRVIMTIKSAHNMNDKAFIGKSDPYCIVRCSDAEIQTAHVKNAGEHCTWDESFAFNNVAPTDIITFKVYDHNRLIKDAFMGEGSLSLRQVFEEGRLETRVPLADRAGVKDAGEIWITLRLEGGPAGTGADATGVGSGIGAGEGALAGAGYESSKRYDTEREGISTTETGYGERERFESREAAIPASALETTRTGETATGYAGERGAVGEAVQTGREAVCGQEFFTKVEDRPIVKERVTYIKEHRPVEKEFVVETRATGVERHTRDIQQEKLDETTRVVSEAQPRGPCE